MHAANHLPSEERTSEFFLAAAVTPPAAASLLAGAAPAEGDTANEIAQTVARLTAGYAYTKPAEAARWATSLPPGPSLVSSVRSAATSWSTHDPTAARAWAETLLNPSARAAALQATDSPQ